MNLRIKKQFSTSLLALTMLLTASNVTLASDKDATSTQKNNNEQTDHVTITTKMWVTSLVFLVPMWQCLRKSPKSVIPAEEEYSWKEIKESLHILWNHYSNKSTKWLRSKSSAYSDKEIVAATNKLWHNIKNLYNMGIVGQKKYQSLLKLKGDYIGCTESTPARGICGHLLDMMGDCEKTITNFVSLAAGYILFTHTLKHGYKVIVTNQSDTKKIAK